MKEDILAKENYFREKEQGKWRSSDVLAFFLIVANPKSRPECSTLIMVFSPPILHTH
jgi:hypothetical protein